MDAVSLLPEDGVPEELLTRMIHLQCQTPDQIMTEIDEWHFSQDSAASGDQRQQQQQLQHLAVMLTGGQLGDDVR